ncbi:TRAP transporter substrate-binding protein DctP [Oceanobacillus salinisoli]|uniref:TRAP transporter substrate-binding protein DctP n=1 Tax=Oceanobacillus salinisoli TaxID=2678611 RepID=UPI0012E31D40|nr:TRAP transporter substrate-binding protein DctP [Oceanobacillus salinisoli]
MKKWLNFILLLFFVLLISGCVEQSSEDSGSDSESSSSDGNNENTIVLKLSSALSTQNGWWGGYFQPWMEKVEERTDGRVEFEFYTNGELIPVNEELQALNNGTIDIAAPLWPLYDPQRFPLSEVTMLPLLDTDTLRATKAYAELVKSDREIMDGKTFNEIEYQDRGLKVFATPTTEEYVISTKDYTFETAEDFKNVSLRSPSRVHELFARHVGINTISMPSTEMFDAINRGAFEGSFFSISDWTSYGLQDTFTFTLEGINLGHYAGMWAMTEEKWNTIPEEIQQIMEETSYEQILEGAQLWMERSEENRKNAEDRGAVFEGVENLDQEAQELLEKGVEDTWFEWIDEQEENGQPGKEMAKLWRDLIVEEGITVPESIMEIE